MSRKQFLETLSASATFLPLIVNLFRDLQIPGNSVGPVIYQPRATKRNGIYNLAFDKTFTNANSRAQNLYVFKIFLHTNGICFSWSLTPSIPAMSPSGISAANPGNAFAGSFITGRRCICPIIPWLFLWPLVEGQLVELLVQLLYLFL